VGTVAPGRPIAAMDLSTGGRLRAPDVLGIQLGQGLVLPEARGGQDQFDARPVLAGLLRDLGEVADREQFAVEGEVVQRAPGGARDVIGELHLGPGWPARASTMTDTSANPTVRSTCFSACVEAPLGGFELAAGSAPTDADVAAVAQGPGVVGQMAGPPTIRDDGIITGRQVPVPCGGRTWQVRITAG
jgi:hypothetical protein